MRPWRAPAETSLLAQMVEMINPKKVDVEANRAIVATMRTRTAISLRLLRLLIHRSEDMWYGKRETVYARI